MCKLCSARNKPAVKHGRNRQGHGNEELSMHGEPLVGLVSRLQIIVFELGSAGLIIKTIIPIPPLRKFWNEKSQECKRRAGMNAELKH
jgi:hypothetical protein